jgi:hypothetical protein
LRWCRRWWRKLRRLRVRLARQCNAERILDTVRTYARMAEVKSKADKPVALKDPVRRLRLFDQATERHHCRPPTHKVKSESAASWTREDLYELIFSIVRQYASQ